MVTIYLVPAPELSPNVLADADIAQAAEGLQAWINAPHTGPASAYSQGYYPVRAVPRSAPVPRGDRSTWIVWLKNNSDVPGAAGYHDVINDKAPVAYVFVVDILGYGMSWTAVASHEIVEMMVDRDTNDLVYATYNGGFGAYMKEACDPCERFSTQFSYGAGKQIAVSEFVRPAYWFQGSAPYSSLGNVKSPLAPAPGCRQVVGPMGEFTTVTGDHLPEKPPQRASLEHARISAVPQELLDNLEVVGKSVEGPEGIDEVVQEPVPA